MAQWWRICLPMQETQVRSLIQEDPTCGRATKPMCHNYWACAPEPENHNYWVCSQQLLKLAPPRACAPQQEQWEAYVPQLDSSPGSPPLEKSPRSNKDPTKTKINKQHCLKKKKKKATHPSEEVNSWVWKQRSPSYSWLCGSTAETLWEEHKTSFLQL